MNLLAMDYQLPPRSDGQVITIDRSSKQLIIIGANGAGKTRFANRMASDLGDRAFRVSALRGLYGHHGEDTSPGSVDSLYHEAVSHSGLINADISGQLERIIALLLNEEMVNLLQYKLRAAAEPSNRQLALPRTRLDKITKLWQEVFPETKISVESGRMLFGRRDNDDAIISSGRLSDGERTVLYHIGAVLFAPKNADIFVESPEMFLHPSATARLWDNIEALRPDCKFIYITHDLDFASTRRDGQKIWVRSYDPVTGSWNYDILPPHEGISEELYLAIIGARKPVLFVEGDGVNSIDAQLYPLVFKEYTVKSLGSCNKVIEATRAFNDLADFHHLDSHGIVDRDRRSPQEVEYLRGRKILVPDVAEIENIMMLEEVIRTVASHFGRDESAAFAKVKRAIIKLFDADLRSQALQHTRHRVKVAVEHRIDGRFSNISQLEEHIKDLTGILNAHGLYDGFCRDFHRYVNTGDYASILRVYNRKSMITESHVTEICGVRGGDRKAYIRTVIDLIRADGAEAERIRAAVRRCFGFE
jgi:hypothetical protein